jgi:L-threonylcarbamoyladenylate synthase
VNADRIIRVGRADGDAPRAIAAALEALAAGWLVVFPTETVYGIAANAGSPATLGRLARLTEPTRAGHPAAAAWHAPTPEAVERHLRPSSPLHRRAVRRLLPGPVTLVFEKSPDELEEVRLGLHGAPGSFFVGREMAVRVPDHPFARALLEAAAARAEPDPLTIVADGLAAAGQPGWGRGEAIADALRRAVEAGPGEAQPIALVLDDGRTRWARPSTTVRLLASGGYRIDAQGAMPDRIVEKHLQRAILFVCTGNTCRSPMAEAIARALLTGGPAASGGAAGMAGGMGGEMGAGPEGPAAGHVKVTSAGAGASGGTPVSPEAIEALAALGLPTADLSRHRSRELTRAMVAEADEIYVMAAPHAQAVLAIDPTARAKVRLLDPSGEDVPDPIGSTQEVYSATARRLKHLISRRLQEE